MAPETYHINSINQCCGLIATVHVHVQYVIVLATCSMQCGPLARRVMVSWLHLTVNHWVSDLFIILGQACLPALGPVLLLWEQPSGSGTSLPSLGPTCLLYI